MTWEKRRRTGLNREKENQAKTAEDVEARLLNSSCSIFHMICCNCDELSNMAEKGDFSSVIMKEDLIEKNFAK